MKNNKNKERKYKIQNTNTKD